MSHHFCTAIVLAAGSGKRMGLEISKQFLKIREKSILAYTIEAFENCKFVDEIILVTSDEYVNYCREEILIPYNFKKVKKICIGGSERQDSVAVGLKNIDDRTEIILIHDGVRPFITENIIKESILSAFEYGACAVGVRAKDTVKYCDEKGFVEQTPDRNRLWQIQTPQAFKCDIIKKAHTFAAVNNYIGTDDASLVEKIGLPVKIIEGSYENIKITTPEDLLIANGILEKRLKC